MVEQRNGVSPSKRDRVRQRCPPVGVHVMASPLTLPRERRSIFSLLQRYMHLDLRSCLYLIYPNSCCLIGFCVLCILVAMVWLCACNNVHCCIDLPVWLVLVLVWSALLDRPIYTRIKASIYRLVGEMMVQSLSKREINKEWHPDYAA